MMTYTLKCKVPGCKDKKTGKRYVTPPKETETIAKQALQMHVLRKHRNMGHNKGVYKQGKKSKVAIPMAHDEDHGCPQCQFLISVCHALLEAVGNKK
jgi:hypothetical protein